VFRVFSFRVGLVFWVLIFSVVVFVLCVNRIENFDYWLGYQFWLLIILFDKRFMLLVVADFRNEGLLMVVNWFFIRDLCY
jgi:hypothetical protein